MRCKVFKTSEGWSTSEFESKIEAWLKENEDKIRIYRFMQSSSRCDTIITLWYNELPPKKVKKQYEGGMMSFEGLSGNIC